MYYNVLVIPIYRWVYTVYTMRRSHQFRDKLLGAHRHRRVLLARQLQLEHQTPQTLVAKRLWVVSSCHKQSRVDNERTKQNTARCRSWRPRRGRRAAGCASGRTRWRTCAGRRAAGRPRPRAFPCPQHRDRHPPPPLPHVCPLCRTRCRCESWGCSRLRERQARRWSWRRWRRAALGSRPMDAACTGSRRSCALRVTRARRRRERPRRTSMTCPPHSRHRGPDTSTRSALVRRAFRSAHVLRGGPPSHLHASGIDSGIEAFLRASNLLLVMDPLHSWLTDTIYWTCRQNWEWLVGSGHWGMISDWYDYCTYDYLVHEWAGFSPPAQPASPALGENGWGEHDVLVETERSAFKVNLIRYWWVKLNLSKNY